MHRFAAARHIRVNFLKVHQAVGRIPQNQFTTTLGISLQKK
jgi:hypothetical protein